jgi:recombination protein RecA
MSDDGFKAALAAIEKQWGKGAAMVLGEAEIQKVPVVSTGSLALDIATKVGGYPRGRIIEMYGPESSGKTTLALEHLREVQHAGLRAAFIDAEHALDPNWAMALGVDVGALVLAQPSTGEEALDITDKLVRSSGVGTVVVDSVAALTPKAELEGEVGDSHMGLQARMMSQAMRMLTANIKRTGTTVLFLNQIRHKIGVYFGSPETTTGGKALPFYATMRLDVRRIGTIKKKDEVIGNQVRIKLKKNKVAPPWGVAEVDMMFDHGVDKVGELVDIGAKLGVLKKSGNWYSFEQTRLGNGKDAAKDGIMSTQGLSEEIRKRILEQLP